MKTILAIDLILVCCLLYTGAHAQNLNGLLLDRNTGSPIPGARVWIPGGDSYPATTTDGEFLLNLKTGNHHQPGGELELYISHDDYGFHRERIIISQQFKALVEIDRSNIIGIFGAVRDRGTGAPIARIEVTPTSEDVAHPDRVQLPITETDANGRFQIILNKSTVGNVKYVRLAFRDKNGQCYEYKDGLYNIGGYLDIDLNKVKCNETELNINTYTPRAIPVKLGDLISIDPSGSMEIGGWVGNSTPKGKEDGVLGITLSPYSFYPDIPHAALLYRFSWEPRDAWKYCGEKLEITAQRDGYLEFNVNDKQQYDNKGAYQVKVAVSK